MKDLYKRNYDAERKRLKQESNKAIYMEMVELVSTELDIPIEEITRKSRKAEIIEARQFVYKLCVLKGMYPYNVSQQANKTGPTILHNLAEELGDLMNVCSNNLVFLGYDPIKILEQIAEKNEKRKIK